MSRYLADGRRRSSMRHAERVYHCTCGKVVRGKWGPIISPNGLP